MRKNRNVSSLTRIIITAALIIVMQWNYGAPALGDVHYASPSGSDTPPYTSWSTAATVIQDAVDAAESGDTVMVGAGTYSQEVQVHNKDIDLIGSGIGETVITDYSLQINNVTGGKLEGFTVSGVDGFAVNHWWSDGYLIAGNEMKEADWGIASFNSTNTVIEDNYIHDCNDTGIGITTMDENSSTAAVQNNLTERCGWHIKSETNCTVTAYNNTIKDAYPGSWAGGLLSLHPTSDLYAYNNIITGVMNGISSQDGGSVTADYNTFWDIDNDNYYSNCSGGASDAVEDPQLAAHLHLLPGSPCLDTGMSSGAPSEDYDGETRPQAGGIDRGADEWLDTDGDGLPDWWEGLYGDLEPEADGDSDDLTNADEYYYGTDPTAADSDGDGLDDGEELTEGADGYITDPHDPDTDGDGLEDGTVDLNTDGMTEGGAGTNPTRGDTDGDGIPDLWEVINSVCVDPLTGDEESDPDGDTAVNWVEYLNGTDPCDGGVAPTLTTLYVDDDAPNDPGPGDPDISDPDEDGSMAHPYDSIQEALMMLTTPGDGVEVFAGSYNESLTVQNAAGYLTGAGPEQTTITATDYFVAHGSDIPFGVFSGFTLSGGDYSFDLHQANMTISDCRMEQYQQRGVNLYDCDGATIENSTLTGGQEPIRIEGSEDVTVRGCEIRNWSGWSACSFSNSSGLAENNHIHHCTSSGDAVQLHGDTEVTVKGNMIHDCPFSSSVGVYSNFECTITGNVFRNNFRGLTVNESQPVITNNLISGSTENGVGVWSWNEARPGFPKVINNTIFDNNYEGVYIWGEYAGAEIRNNIIYRNSVGITAMEGESIPPTVDYNCFWNNNSTYQGDVTPGPNDMTADPSLTISGRMMASSPCIDQAEDLYAPDIDIDEETRPEGSQSDMGADEWVDGDGDGLPDWFETEYGEMTPESDLDNDDLTALDEYYYGTDPTTEDTDSDGLEDGEELTEGTDGYITDPVNEDTDGDGLEDDGVDINGDGLTETGAGTSPVLRDTDNDGMSDYWEAGYMSCVDPVTADAFADPDGDDAANWLECARFTDPCDDGSVPTVTAYHVDDDGPNDPGPGDPNVSDPDEDGSELHPYDSINEIFWNSQDGDTILVHEGSYNEEWLHMQRALFLRAAPGETPVLENTCVNVDPMSTNLEKMAAGCIEGFIIRDAGNSGNWTAISCLRVLRGFEINDNLIYDQTPNVTQCGINLNMGSSPTIRNNRIARMAQVGINIYSNDDVNAPLIINNVIYGCGADWGQGRGIGAWQNSDVTLSNTIVTGNYRGIEASSPSAYTLNNNCVFGNIAGQYSGCSAGPDDVSQDPMLMNPDNRDFRIPPNSPCRDAGTSTDVPAGDTDFEGEARPNPDTGIVDIGADEWHMVDTDGDNMDDLWESFYPCMTVGTDDSGDDFDDDGFTNLEEFENGYLNPCNEDTDGDGLEDNGTDLNGDGYTEESEGTDPADDDSDDDGMPDGYEVENGLNPLADDADDDADGDGFSNYDEYRYGTDPQDDQDHPPFMWEKVADQGFGDTGNRFRTVITFGDYLYIGTDNPYNGAQIWRSPDGTTWEQIITDGFGDMDNRRIQCFAEYQGYLYAGTGKNSLGGELWRSADGMSWEAVAADEEPGAFYDDGFGDDANIRIFDLYAETGMLWAGTLNASGNAQIWRSADGETWEQAVSDGFGQLNGMAVTIRTFQDACYAALVGTDGGCQLWTSDTGDAGTWTQIMSGGFGDADNVELYLYGPFNGYLYGGTWNYVAGGELWRSEDGMNWEPVIADEVDPDDEGTDENGLGNPNNMALSCTLLHQGTFCVMADYNEIDGASIWANVTDDSSALHRASLDGWGNKNNMFMIGPVYFDYCIYAASYNWVDGGEVHRAWLPMAPEEVPAMSWLSLILLTAALSGLIRLRRK